MLDAQLGASDGRDRAVPWRLVWTSAVLVVGVGGCPSCERGPVGVDAGASETASTRSVGAVEAGAAGDLAPDGAAPDEPEPEAEPTCPREMVLVDGRYCVDRYEAALVDVATERALSPYYPPSPRLAYSAEQAWKTKRLELGDPAARALGLPALPAWQRTEGVEPRAVSARGLVPQGYVSGVVAERACKSAGKRLCTLGEWRTACRGERDKPFPYGEGDRYVAGKCNVFREAHPAMVLHGDFSVGHTDPRLNLVEVKGQPLLRKTGATSECISEWGDDGVADMVGNLDEWVEDSDGTFVGGFYARATKEGCASTVSTHGYAYYDYSTGIRCCRDLASEGDEATKRR